VPRKKFYDAGKGKKPALGGTRRHCPRTTQPAELELFIESNDGSLVENANHLTVACWGDLILCEDASSA
jgi:hypothetical protein